MWNWFNCRVSGRHEYGVWCEPGAIYLRCVHCKRRSSGWAVDAGARRFAESCPPEHASPAQTPAPAPATTIVEPTRTTVVQVHARARNVQSRKRALPKPAEGARVLPFARRQQISAEQPELRQAG